VNSEPLPATGQPIGLPVDTTPAKRPEPALAGAMPALAAR